MTTTPELCAGCESAPAVATHASGDRLCRQCHAAAVSYSLGEAAGEAVHAVREACDDHGIDLRDDALRAAIMQRIDRLIARSLGRIG